MIENTPPNFSGFSHVRAFCAAWRDYFDLADYQRQLGAAAAGAPA